MRLKVKIADYFYVFLFYFIGYFFLIKLLLNLEKYTELIIGVTLLLVTGFFLKRWESHKSKVYQQVSWKIDTRSRIESEIKWSLINGLIFSFVTLLTLVAVEEAPLQTTMLKKLVVLSFGFVLWSLTVNLFGEFLHLLSSIKRTKKRIDQEKSEVIKLKREVLQDLISPHFLFNSLNTISTFISENRAKSIRIVKELSDLYGFIINNVHKNVVSLKEDLELAKKYSFLLKSRLESGVEIVFAVPDRYFECFIPPMTLQNLVENCVKHNVVTKKSILQIDIFVENEYIVVKNNLNLKMNSGVGSTNLGLNYIKSQMELIADKKVIITKDDKEFIVKIPLVYNVNSTDDESVNN